MPFAPKRPCTYPGCPELTKKGRCEKHKKQDQRNYDKNQRNPDAKRFYNSKFWRGLSRQCRQRAYGMCEACRSKGLLNPGKQADHIVPREQGGTDTIDNLQWLCDGCHGRKSAKEGSRWGGAG